MKSLNWKYYLCIFQEAHIYSNIVETERNEKEILNWVKGLKSHRYELTANADGQVSRSVRNLFICVFLSLFIYLFIQLSHALSQTHALTRTLLIAEPKTTKLVATTIEAVAFLSYEISRWGRWDGVHCTAL